MLFPKYTKFCAYEIMDNDIIPYKIRYFVMHTY